MDPKSNASNALSSLSNSLNTGSTFGAPQYTPPGTPLPVTPPPAPTHAYMPPSFGASQPAPVPRTPVAATPSAPAAPLPTMPTAPTFSPQAPALQQTAPHPQPPMQQPLHMAQPVFPPPPVSQTYTPQQPRPAPQPSMQQTLYTTPSHMQSAQHMPGEPLPPHKSRIVPFLTAMLAVIVLLITGALYLYGKTLVQGGKTTPPAQTEQAPAPENGFQVTESGVTEPNFDQDQLFDSAAPTQVNTDTSQMFDQLAE